MTRVLRPQVPTWAHPTKQPAPKRQKAPKHCPRCGEHVTLHICNFCGWKGDVVEPAVAKGFPVRLRISRGSFGVSIQAGAGTEGDIVDVHSSKTGELLYRARLVGRLGTSRNGLDLWTVVET